MLHTHPVNPDTPFISRPQASLRAQALRLLQIEAASDKAAQVHALHAADWPLDVDEILPEPPHLPGRPEQPQLVHPSRLKTRAVGTLEGRAGLIHALTHIEANAINTVYNKEHITRTKGARYGTCLQLHPVFIGKAISRGLSSTTVQASG